MTSTTNATTRTQLQSIVKECRNIMRKDAGLNGELDRLPQLAWLLFLRAYDEAEETRRIGNPDYKQAIEGRYRWSKWARDSVTGEPFLSFVNEQLLPYLSDLRGSGEPGDPRDTIASIFRDFGNRMQSGHLLKDLVSQIDRINFASSDDIHTLAHVYESMLREMRDAAGDSGEFYTPRPLVRLIVDMVDPKPGETVLDPAAGTGGFLTESLEHMLEQEPSAGKRAVVRDSVRGIEKKPLPFLLSQMNLLLHEVDRPRLVRSNTLASKLDAVRSDGVDVVVTNPPFGGEEEVSIRENFPTALRTSETVWLFLQHVMARIESSPNGRCGIVVPNSVMFDQGVGARIKAKLMEKFNLHTVLRLPEGVFAPYTPIPSNVLFFDKGQQSDDVWFYEQPLPEGRKRYTKTKPLQFDEFADFMTWWGGSSREGRVEDAHAWKVSAESIREGSYNLDLHNPHRPDDLTHRPVAEIVDELIANEREILDLLTQLQRTVTTFEAGQ
ncbi:N-6 DNA methylase [Dermacoccus abyssi]